MSMPPVSETRARVGIRCHGDMRSVTDDLWGRVYAFHKTGCFGARSFAKEMVLRVFTRGIGGGGCRAGMCPVTNPCFDGFVRLFSAGLGV